MTDKDIQLRKAAILIAALDDDAADALLERMSPEHAGLIRRSVVELRTIDDAEQQLIIREFVLGGGRTTAADEAGVELDLSRPMPTFGGAPFRFLHEASEADLGELLAAESPQVAAVVVSQLPPEQAARALAALPEPLQAEVVRRLARLDGSDSSVLREIEAGLEQRYRRRFAFEGRRAVGPGGVKQIFSEAAPETRGRWLSNISRQDPNLAAQLADPVPHFSFDELDRLTDASLGLLMEQTEESVLVPALAGVELTFLARINQVLPRVRAARLQRAVDNLGSLRLSDIDAAQEQVVAEAVRLTSLGRLEWDDAAGTDFTSPRDAAAA